VTWETKLTLTPIARRAIYGHMMTSRLFDEECAARLQRGEPLPHYHSGVGQEALMVAPVASLRPEDRIIYTHRGYGHLMAKGVSPREIAHDLLMKVGGTNLGLGGVMHVHRPDLGVMGREGVFGTRFGLAAGFGLASKLRGEDTVTLCFYGEAAGARGLLYEALNMCKLWRLPVVFVAENNGWSFTSRTEWLYPSPRMSDAWKGFVPVQVVDGNDVEEVWAATDEAVERARSGGGPTVVEGMTYRLAPHIWFDDAGYQPAEEVERRRKDDPLPRFRGRLLELGEDTADLERVEAAARHDVSEAWSSADAARLATWDDTPWLVKA
jgi:TPP-dependent pyruvate/acetoin dehydrogenase alpha subunit